MCGIAGISTGTPTLLRDTSRLYKMQEILRHRGPDDEGVAVVPEAGIGLVHTRLSIIDLSSAGHQPMWNDEKTVAIVFNGEIYNFPQIRRELETTGLTFRSRSDTEVILRGYEAWGIDVVDRLNGMFAFALWDGREKRLWLVRDRLGKKPLYYWHDSARGILLFASELKALFVWPDIPRNVDPEALHCYLALGYVPAPYTMFQGINKLPAAHWLRYDANGLQIRRYWDVLTLGTWQASRADYRKTIRAAVEQAVQSRLLSDVPLGAFLSGGVDSSIVVGLMSQLMGEPVRTFSTAFDVGPRSSKYNVDADTAEVVSGIFATCHTRLTVRPEDRLLYLLKKVLWHMEEPHANPTSLTTYLLAQLVREQGTTVILSGDGGDELFGGYSRYMADRYVTGLRRVPPVLRNFLTNLGGDTHGWQRLSRALRKADIPPRSSQWYLTWWEHYTPKERSAILTAPWCEALEAPNSCIEAVLARTSTSNDQELLSYADLALWIADESNMRVDKMSMAQPLEVRAPFLDYRLVEQVMAIPLTQKMGWWEGKRLLKEAFADLLPDVVLKRPKWGWFSPVYYWVKDLLWEEARNLINWLPETGIFTPQVARVVEDYPPCEPQKVWTLMVFALWYQEYIANGQN